MLREKRLRFIGGTVSRTIGEKSIENSRIRGTLLVLVFMLVSGVFSYAENVKYHGLGSDARRVYVKEIKDLPLDYVNYDWYYDRETGYLYGQPKKTGYSYLYVDLYKYKVFFRTNGGALMFDSDKKYMAYFSEPSSVYIYELKSMKKKKYNILKIDKAFMKGAMDYGFYRLYDQYHLIGLEHPKEKVFWISLGDMRTGKIKKMCKIEGYDHLNYIKYFDGEDIFYEVDDKNYNPILYRLSVKGCKVKKILDDYGMIDDMYQAFYRNYKGEIRINLGYEVRDKSGRIVNSCPDISKKVKRICGTVNLDGYAMVSPDDMFVILGMGELDPEDQDHYWIKGGKRCVLLYDYKGNVIKLNLLQNGDVPDRLYWHPLGDRLIMENKGSKIKIVILGRR